MLISRSEGAGDGCSVAVTATKAFVVVTVELVEASLKTILTAFAFQARAGTTFLHGSASLGTSKLR